MISLQVIRDCLPAFRVGLLNTVELVALAALLGGLLGFALNALQRLGSRAAGKLVAAYVSFVRGTPFLAQLYVVYFGLPALGLSLGAFQAAVLSLTLYTAAYASEIFRGSWETLPPGQREAARALGIGSWACFVYLEAPQALRLARPLLVNQAILTVKESALASLVTYPELTMQAGKLVAEQFVYVEPYLLLALAYWGLSLTIQLLGSRLQGR